MFEGELGIILGPKGDVLAFTKDVTEVIAGPAVRQCHRRRI